MIRTATDADARALAALHKASFGPRGERVWEEGEWPGLLAPAASRCLVWADDAGQVQAALLCQIAGPDADVVTIMTAPEARGQGLANRLLTDFIAAAAAEGVSALILEVAEDNHPAIALYRKHGFIEAGRRPRYYARAGAPAVDALVMRRDAPPA